MVVDALATLDDVQTLYTWFAEKRRTQPVWFDKNSGCWHTFRYADVHHILSDSTLFSSEISRRTTVRPARKSREPGSHLESSLISLDPPRHRRYRSLIAPAFTPRAIARLQNRVVTITQELLDAARPRGHMDVVADLAYPLPTIVIGEMLGVPRADRPQFKRWADILLAQQLGDTQFFRFQKEQQTSSRVQHLSQNAEEMYGYFEGLLDARRFQSHDDLIDMLVAAEFAGEHLSREEVVRFCMLLLLAGHLTTTNLISQAVRCFDEHPEALASIRCEPALLPGALEEVLRYASPVWRLTRTTKEDVKIGGITVPRGALIFCWVASANRDERVFSEPDRFDILRNPNKHLTFGHGVHFCIGAPLSRLEAPLALAMLLGQMPDLRRVRSEPLEMYDGYMLFGFKRLPVAFTPSFPVEEA